MNGAIGLVTILLACVGAVRVIRVVCRVARNAVRTLARGIVNAARAVDRPAQSTLSDAQLDALADALIQRTSKRVAVPSANATTVGGN